MTNQYQDFKLVYRHGGRRLERVFNDTLYANVKRVADSFPPTVLWRIVPAENSESQSLAK